MLQKALERLLRQVRKYYYRGRPLPQKLAYAIWDGDLETVETLLRQGYNANAKTPHGGYIPKERKEQVTWNSYDNRDRAPWRIPRYDWISGSTPAICLAVDDSYPRREALTTILPMLAVLVAHGADVNTPYIWDISLLHQVASRGFASACKLLLDCGADPNPPFENITPLNTALMGVYCRKPEGESLWSDWVHSPVDYEATVAYLLAAGAKAGIHEAALMGDVGALQMLLHETCDLEKPIGHGLTPLMYAAIGGHTEAVEALLEAGVNKEAEDPDHWTALMHAAAQNQVSVIQNLVDAGVDVDYVIPPKHLSYTRDNYPFSALIAAACNGHIEAVELLRSQMRQNVPSLQVLLEVAATFGRERLFHWLLAHDSEADNLSTTNWDHLLINTIPGPKEVSRSFERPKRNSKGRAAIAEWLLEQGADANASSHGFPALLSVVWADRAERCLNAELIELLLQHGADVNGRDLTEPPSRVPSNYISTYGWTALMATGNLETTQILLKWGADVHIRDNAGNTALRLAKKYNLTKKVELLERAGATE